MFVSLVSAILLSSISFVAAAPAADVQDRSLTSLIDKFTATKCPAGYTAGSVSNEVRRLPVYQHPWCFQHRPQSTNLSLGPSRRACNPRPCQMMFPVPVSTLLPVVDDFFDSAWEGFTPISTQGNANWPGALRTFSFNGAVTLTEQLNYVVNTKVITLTLR